MSNPLSPLAASRQNTRAISIRQSSNYDVTEYNEQRQEIDNDDSVSDQALQSSPFRFDARDDTVDMQMLQKHQTSLGMSERSATPRKRSYDQAPDVHEIETGESDRYKKSPGRRDIPDVNVYADEDSGYSHDLSFPGGGGQNIASSMVEEKRHEGMSTVLGEDRPPVSSRDGSGQDVDDTNDAMTDEESHDPMDDTCFSTFSAVPNVDMTAFANLPGGSPFKSPRPLPDFPVEPEHRREGMESPKRSPRKNALIDMSSPVGSPTPRKRDRDDQSTNGTPNLLDLTDQIGLFPRRQRFSIQHERYTPSRRSPLKTPRESMRSPAKMSLLDFDIPAAPTPRSLPTITPRELESLKSGFLSEISSLKATLSGKEAEVSSLKKAVSDAERRVGEALEEVRNEAARKEALEIEQAEWERRGREMEDVLRSVKADILEGEQERERLQKKNEEAEKSKEQLESRVVELETQLTSARKSATCDKGASENAAPLSAKTAEETAKEIQDAVEKVARDLHSLYKEKHETKVAALKKSYESRWEKRLREAEKKLKAASDECERVKAERDATSQESARPDASMMARENEEHEAEKHVLEAQIKGLRQEILSLKSDSEQLRIELKAERAEKGDLVALVEEWLTMQNQSTQPSQSKNDNTTPELVSHEQLRPTDDFEREVPHSSSSGLRGPSSGSSSSSGHGERKIPKIGASGARHVRGNSGGKSGIAIFTPGRSGIMGSIERMGRGGAA
ncbi:hypothetical protein ASPVEDRAFT_49699 [Aspergillus versicolor CBS 583.65]|uniref:Uncharacterized protein n=1 Tax=Aspergillus versicolor CBS 583.65 TaxID=1036611 RepID=A0A1L9P8C0_ASPVE|nr:uncharacterized protein ASPVEDRAFT_49699 [Aspergillus versicolor CBS 583.65]OJI97745.1 hypothetical protein ASPVEDRAFT_49699 [Aspergillus versicolor CBS 583.65]